MKKLVALLAPLALLGCEPEVATAPEASFAAGGNRPVPAAVAGFAVDGPASYLEQVQLSGVLTVGKLKPFESAFVRLQIHGVQAYRDGDWPADYPLPHDAFCGYNPNGHLYTSGEYFKQGVYDLARLIPAGSTCGHYPDPVPGVYELVLIVDVRGNGKKRARQEYRVPLTLLD